MNSGGTLFPGVTRTPNMVGTTLHESSLLWNGGDTPDSATVRHFHDALARSRRTDLQVRRDCTWTRIDARPRLH